jgi:hypothetical protein
MECNCIVRTLRGFYGVCQMLVHLDAARRRVKIMGDPAISPNKGGKTP